MSSIPLPRVLQPRRTNSLHVEKENFEKAQTISINKAVNNQEAPVKEKHVRSAIIGTFQGKGATTFWSVVTKLPLQGNPIVCWKFCHTLHKLLREGHPNVIAESLKYRSVIEDLGKLWGHLKEGYGKLICCYTRLLVAKLDFHRRNPRFPGNLQLTNEQLDDIGERDVNNYFQITVEMFDYMDEILNLQSAIFGSLDMSRSNSMTSTGQCRLAPLIPCIQDSSQLYDYCVKLLFKLHSSRSQGLPPDTLIGHSDRFRKQFHQLRQFYLSSSTLQYFKYLIQIPLLPENPPNFLVQSDLSSHVSPVVILPPQVDTPDNDSVDMVLVDTSSPDLLTSDDSFERNGSISPEQMTEKDRLIEQLLKELDELRMEMQRIKIEDQQVIDDLKRQIMALESQIAELQRNLQQKTEEIEKLQKELSESAQIGEAVSKLQDLEKKAKGSEEKFQRMKDVYNKFREEHISLLQEKAKAEKQLAAAVKASEDAQRIKIEIEEKLQRSLSEKQIAEETLVKSSGEASEQLTSLISAKNELENSSKELEEKIQILNAEKESLKDQLRDFKKMQDDLESKYIQLEIEKSESELKLQKNAEDDAFKLLVDCVEESEFIIKNSMFEFDNPAFIPLTCTSEYLLSQMTPLLQSLDKLKLGHSKYTDSPNSVDDLLRSLTSFTCLLGQFILAGKATSNASPDIEQGEKLANESRDTGKATLELFEKLKCKDGKNDVIERITSVQQHIELVANIAEALSSKMIQTDDIADLIESELQSMDKAIEEAAKRFEDFGKSREGETGIKLEVNSKILDACTALMQTIRILVQRSKDLQAEIVLQGRGTASVKEFYKRNHRWTEGLISAAKAVGLGAKFLVDAADKVLSGNAKFEELMVVSQEIAASTAQLVIASKVKADRNSENLSRLSKASKNVSEATGNVVATAKSCAQMMEDNDVLDFSNFSLHQAKRHEMESQVKVLELESQLSKERLRLAALRKRHYMLAGPSEGWDETDIIQ